MKVIETRLPGAVVIEPKVFGDARGFFYESYNEAKYRDAGIDRRFVQSNVSRSARGVLRGLHYQWPNPHANWSACWRVRCTTWPWTSAAAPPPSASGLA